MKQYNGEKYIVSFTSFGKRFDYACKMIYSLMQQTYKNFHLVMTVYKDDLKDITPNMQLLIDNDILEVLIADRNLCPHLKYYYAMKKYSNKPIITVDDDRRYNINLISSLVNKYESLNYKSIISVCAPKMMKNSDKLLDRFKWSNYKQRLRPNEKSYIAVAEGFAGVLYPANCFEDLSKYDKLIEETLFDDDMTLKAMEILEKIPVTQIAKKSDELFIDSYNLEGSQDFRLATHNNAGNEYRKNITNQLSQIFLQGWNL